MTYSAFMYSLRFLVLCGLFLNSPAYAIAYWIGNYTGQTPYEACNAWLQPQRASDPASVTRVIVSTSGTHCNWNHIEVYYGNTYVTPQQPQFIDSSCNSTRTLEVASPTIVLSGGGVDSTRLPVSQCDNSCKMDFSQSLTDSVNYARDGSPAGLNFCTPPNSPVGSTVQCYGTFKNTGAVCNLPQTTCNAPYVLIGGSCSLPPVCTSPEVLDSATNTCKLPACPSGQTRVTTSAACSVIQCVAPMVKVDNKCEIPTCPTGSSYEFQNGSGQCVKNLVACTPPQTMINGSCQNPVCAAGTALNANGQCGVSAGAPSTGATGSGTTPTTSTTSGTSTTTTTNTSTGSTATTTTTSTTTGATGTGSGSGGSGTCTTPPCGACDPAKETCGTTFGGSCKSDFQCTGDAIQCAVAKATNKAECAVKALLIDTETDTAYIEGKASFDAGTKALGTAGGIQVASGGNITINSDNPYSSSCPADVHLFEYKGSSYAMPLSKYCNIFQIMGNIMLLAASLIALKIIMKVD